MKEEEEKENYQTLEVIIYPKYIMLLHFLWFKTHFAENKYAKKMP